jgi:hypothetical protein
MAFLLIPFGILVTALYGKKARLSKGKNNHGKRGNINHRHVTVENDLDRGDGKIV